MKLAQRLMMRGQGVGASDPFWSDVQFLIQPGESQIDGDTSIYDYGPVDRSITRSGNIQIDDSLGVKSISCDGSGDYAYMAHDSALQMDANATLDAWIRPANIADNKTVLSKRSSYTVGDSWLLRFRNNLPTFTIITSGDTWQSLQSTTSISTNENMHIAVTVNDNRLYKIFFNGVLEGTMDLSSYSLTLSGAVLRIARQHDYYTSRDYSGHIYALRYTSAIRYTSDFTPDPFPYQLS